MKGENFVSLIGKIMWPKLKTVGDKNYSLFNANLAIPIDGDKFQYVKIAAWGDKAEALNEVQPSVFIKVHGHIEERSYMGPCKHCGEQEKKYWTNVVVDNFVIMEG